MQNKKFFALSLLILIAPACNRRKNGYNAAITPVGVVSDENQVNNPADIKEFELDEANPLSAENNLNPSDLELVSEDAGDSYNDSGRYGLKRVFFDFDQYDIRPDQKQTLDNNTKVVKDLVKKNYDVVVEGHSDDSAGTPEYNLLLSEKRAQEVAKHMAKSGVAKDKVKTVGRGSEMRIVKSGDKDQQAPNRRVEIFAYEK